jgi:transcription initiation factor TFIIIB Brf1 subunit/transcription initiation factor TFIIB
MLEANCVECREARVISEYDEAICAECETVLEIVAKWTGVDDVA